MDYVTRSHVEQIDPGLLPTFVDEIRLEEYLQIVSVVTLIYDAVLTMDREIKFFWKVPRRPVDFVYFMNRYIGILGAVSLLFSNLSEWTRNIANWLTVILVDYVLTIRVLALYSRDRTLSICLYMFLALETTAKVSTRTYIAVSEEITVGGAEGITVCGIDSFPPWQFGVVDWSVQLGYAVILMALALYKASEYWRLSNGFKGFALVKVLVEDQVIYFMAVILVSVFGMLDFTLHASTEIVSDVLDTLGNPSFLCILGSRMLLNLKEAGKRGQNEGTSFVPPSRTVSDIEFGPHPANAQTSQTEEIVDE